MDHKKITLFFAIMILLASCTRPSKTYTPTLLPTITQTPSANGVGSITATQNTTTTPQGTATLAVPTETSAPTQAVAAILPTRTIEPAIEPTEFIDFAVNSTVDGLLLRTGPGTMFDAWRMLGTTDELRVRGTIAGNEWTSVTTADGLEGWVFNKLIATSIDLSQLPILNMDAQVVVGHVRDANGSPVSGIGFEITDGETDLVVVSDKNGDFYWYSPVGTTGTWTITQTAIDCTSNVWATSNCDQMLPGFLGQSDPQSITIELPLSGDAGTFIYK